MSVNSPLRPIADGVLQQFYVEKDITLTAGQRLEDFTIYNYFRVLALSGSGLEVIFGNNQLQTPFTGAGVGVKLDYVLPRLTLINTSGAPLTLTYAIAVGDVSDDRLTVSGVVAVSNTTTTVLYTRQTATGATTFNQVAMSTTAATIASTSANRASLLVKNIGLVDLYVGTTGVTTATGFPLRPNDSVTFYNTNTIQGITASGTTTAAYVQELMT